MGYEFDGPTKVVSLTNGTLEIDVADLWSRWCDWQKVGTNSKYLPMMRFVGGDAISPIKNLGMTFFILNDWKIRPQEADHRLIVNGNLYTDPSGESPFTQTLGNYNVMVEMAVSSLVDSSLAQLPEIEQASFNNRVVIDVINGTAGTLYPLGTQLAPVNNLANAKTIALSRGFDSFYVLGNLTIGFGEDISNQHFYGQGATFNVKKTTITLTSGCITTNAHYHNLMIQGAQGGESNYYDCLIGNLTNAHCHYEECKMVGPVQFSTGIGSTHTTDLIDCYTSNVEYVVDCNGSQLKQVYNNFTGNIKFTNATNAGSIITLNISSGEVVIDSSCTAGTIRIRGNAILTNNSGGTVIKTEGLITENFNRIRHSIESTRTSHPGFGTVFYVDAATGGTGKDTNDGLSYTSPLKTFAAAHALAVSGRGDVIQFIAPGINASICIENLVITKEDVQVRGPGRGQEIKPTTGIGVHIQANNCSLAGMVVRAPTGSSADCIVINGKFSRLDNLYVIGADTGGATPVGSGIGIHLKGGDYHKITNVEVEKCGSDGIKFTDAPLGAEGSPREVLFKDCVVYYNRGSGFNLTATSSNSTRLNVIDNCRILHNSMYGVNIGANVLRTLVRSNNWIKDNGFFPNDGTPVFENEIFVDPLSLDTMIDTMPDRIASNVWEHGTRTLTASGALTSEQSTMLLEMYNLLGLDPTIPLVVTTTSRSAGSISQTIVGDDTTVTVTRV
jgi:hypothetical protein